MGLCLSLSPAFWHKKRVLVTGHSGFKGSWLCLMLEALGAEVHGFALPPPTEPALFDVARVQQGLASSEFADIRHEEVVRASVRRVQPEIILHLAAQPLVRYSYQAPLETYAVNVMGTLHLLEAARQSGSVRAIVVVTTDKCYENREWPWAYRENEALGGHDPYSSSKACAELLSATYRQSFFHENGPALATARAGNVIGGGDWASDRLIPDFLRAIDAGQTLKIRSPHAIRPWQHVLEPLTGYLQLAEALYTSPDFAEAWNFGPYDEDAQSVEWIVKALAEFFPGMQWHCDAAPQPHEAHYLKLDNSKARSRLHWTPRWRLEKALERTVDWHQAWRRGADMRAESLSQITEYLGAAASSGLRAARVGRGAQEGQEEQRHHSPLQETP